MSQNVRALLIVPRLPGTGFTGDRLRAGLHIQALKRAGFVTTLVGGASGAGESPSNRIDGIGRTIPVKTGWRDHLRCGREVLFARAPIQSVLFSGDWAQAVDEAGGGFDLTVLLLARLWPFLKNRLPRCPMVLDYIDALSAASRDASRKDPAAWRRLYWRLETGRLFRMEREAGQAAAKRLATTSRDVAVLPAGTIAVPNGVEIQELEAGSRAPVVAFTGRLKYRPNEIAIRRLLHEIWPRVLAEVPDARLLLGGADPPTWLRNIPEDVRVDVVSPVEDMSRFLRNARAAVAPVDLGMGTPNKIFEAFEAGTPVVGTPEVAERARAVDGARAPVTVAGTSSDFASALARYLKDEVLATRDGLLGREFVERHADRNESLEALIRLYREALGKR